MMEGHSMHIADGFIAAVINAFEANKRLADRAMEQVPDETGRRTPWQSTWPSLACILWVSGRTI
jgi:hypothetical protein